MSWQEILGYIASLIVAISLTMSSIVKLRWINLLGSTLFSVYGFIIGAIPVGLLNGFIAIINIYFLIKMYDRKEFFKVIPATENSLFIKEFIDFHLTEIQKFFPNYAYVQEKTPYRFLMLRNMAVAGVVLAYAENEHTLRIDLDYVSTEYRDLKPGLFLYQHNKQLFIKQGFRKIKALGNTAAHGAYLSKMGFRKVENNLFELEV
jgi:hypothetical protein